VAFHYEDGLMRLAALGSGLVWAFGRDMVGRGWLALRDTDLVCWAALPARDIFQAAVIALGIESNPKLDLPREPDRILPHLTWCRHCPWQDTCSASKKKAPGQ
jgi:hypothetical protein